MKYPILHFPLILLLLIPVACNAQHERKNSDIIGGPCDGCEALYEYGNKYLNPVDTLPLFEETQPKLKITGTVYQSDGKTPAKDVILYIYHTNRKGIYPTKGDETGWARRHGYIRGWAKTDSSGNYTFYTFRPGSYPDRSEPEHIHLTVKEPDKNEYYLDDFVFKDDPLLQKSERMNFTNRGGPGLMKPVLKDGVLHVERDIILGLKIPNYH